MSASNPPLSLWQRIRSFRPPPGQSLVWWMIEMQRGTAKQILAFAAFLFSFHFLFRWSWSMSAAMVVSMFLHECGHAFVFYLAKIRFTILYLFPLGAVAAPIDKKEDERSDQLHWYTISWLLQAGPAVNVVLMLLFAAVQSIPIMDATVSQFARDMEYVNGLLAAMNLVPVWTLDAGQLFNVIYNSLTEREENWFTGILLGSVVALMLFILGIPGTVSWVAVVVNSISRFGWLVFLVVFTLGLLNKQGRDAPLNAYSKQAMNNLQVAVQLALYLILVGLTLWMFAGPLVP